MEKSAAGSLFQKFLDGACSEEELALLESWYNAYAPDNTKKLSDVQWAEDVHNILYNLDHSIGRDSDDSRSIGHRSIGRHSIGRRRSYRLARVAAAACILLGLGFAGYWLIHQKHKEPAVARVAIPDIPPGANRATLTLANGQKIILDGTQDGRLVQQNDITVTKTKDGELVYKVEGAGAAATGTGAAARDRNAATAGGNAATHGSGLIYNTITTPAGGQYQVRLSDGTRVWLNASSSLSYPVSFSGKRTVSITGEAYFEVAADPKNPFLVKTNGEEVEVLGTSFNINSYNDEPAITTTLLQGKVRVNGSTVLQPGQQAGVPQSIGQQAGVAQPRANGQQAGGWGEAIRVATVDTEPIIAWKNNKFMFDRSDIRTIMRMISRWYDVKVVYTGPVTDEKFGGSVSRFSNVSSVLEILQLTGNVHFKIDQRVITVTK